MSPSQDRRARKDFAALVNPSLSEMEDSVMDGDIRENDRHDGWIPGESSAEHALAM
jgi:hypothetical protein